MFIRKIPALLILTILGCSSPGPKKSIFPGRSTAAVHSALERARPEKTQVLVEKIFHAYLLGQDYLLEFDQILNDRPEDAMQSQTYYNLLAVRTLVDEYEEEVEELRPMLKTVASDSFFSSVQKENAAESLSIFNHFLKGQSIPKELRPMVLSNLQSRFGWPEEINLNSYKVNPYVFEETLKSESSKASFQALQAEVKKLGFQIGKFMKEVKGSRSTSSDVIFPSSGSNGNISGRGYPNDTWSLTFDDGPSPRTTPQVLKNLKEKSMKATFFVLARLVETQPQTAMALVQAGMDIASHSYTHPQLTKVGPQTLEKEIGTAKKVIEKRLNKEIKLFRLPYGAGMNAKDIRSKIVDHKLIHVFWNVDTLDWQDKNPKSILARALKQMKASQSNSGIILFHDIHQQSVEASRLLMEHMEKQKIKVCTVQSVVDQINKGLDTCGP